MNSDFMDIIYKISEVGNKKTTPLSDNHSTEE